ncbi:MAG: ATP-binding cassette domain-containing protein, partial [Bacteroidales bacterium]|nr:ATP-binding cassette domain-containing protein [Bacteroidales bacterium]
MPHIYIHRPIARFANFQLQFPEELHLTPEDQLAVIGPNGSGKSMFAQYLLGKIALKGGQVQVLDNHNQTLPRQAIKYIAFKDIHQLSAGFDQYYQKRWNATENEASPLVSEVLGEEKCARALRRFACFQVEKLLQKRLIFLSSGEMRKLQLMEALLDQAQLLIIDNPYIGLDAAGRDSINQILEALIEEKKLQVILLISQ